MQTVSVVSYFIVLLIALLFTVLPLAIAAVIIVACERSRKSNGKQPPRNPRVEQRTADSI